MGIVHGSYVPHGAGGFVFLWGMAPRGAEAAALTASGRTRIVPRVVGGHGGGLICVAAWNRAPYPTPRR